MIAVNPDTLNASTGSENSPADCIQLKPVLTEVLYLCNFSLLTQCAALDFVLESVVDIVPSSTKSLKKTKNLMEKYADLPMDFADATIVCLAEETGIQNVVTFDRKDFTIYRLPKKQSFIIVP